MLTWACPRKSLDWCAHLDGLHGGRRRHDGVGAGGALDSLGGGGLDRGAAVAGDRLPGGGRRHILGVDGALGHLFVRGVLHRVVGKKRAKNR